MNINRKLEFIEKPFVIILCLYLILVSKFAFIFQTKIEKNYKYFFCYVSLGKLENKYTKEMIEHYIKLGVNKFFLGDNNEKNTETFTNILQKYIKDRFVEIIDLIGIKKDQTEFFGESYEKHKAECKWISFFDFDEFLDFNIKNKESAIQDYLSKPKFDKCNVILNNWIIANDNNLVRYDNRSLKERFSNFLYNSEDNRFVKSIIRGNLKYNPWKYNKTSHRPQYRIKVCDSNGNKAKTFNDVLLPPRIDNIYIKHFVTKSVEEYVEKIKRGHPSENTPLKLWITNFFKFNKISKEKVQYLEKKLNISLTKFHYIFGSKINN